MKNKKLLYVLLPGTLLVWGFAIYRIFGAVSSSVESEPQPFLPKQAVEEFIAEDTFSIYPIYRDPFLEESPKIRTHPGQTHAEKSKLPTTAPWPQITYGGIVKNQKSGKSLAMVQVNGQGSVVKAGDMIGDVRILKVFKDSIQVKYTNEIKFVRK